MHIGRASIQRSLIISFCSLIKLNFCNTKSQSDYKGIYENMRNKENQINLKKCIKDYYSIQSKLWIRKRHLININYDDTKSYVHTIQMGTQV